MSESINPHQYLDGADLLFDADQVHAAIMNIAHRLNDQFRNEAPVILSVMNGALYFTGQMLPHLNFPLELDYVHATRYQGDTVGHQVEWYVKPPKNVKGKNVLILDDILDEGVTLKAIVELCKDLGAKTVLTAVLLEKILKHKKPIQADYVGLTVEDRYIFGCGMDINGWWRNLPQIYALKAT